MKRRGFLAGMVGAAAAGPAALTSAGQALGGMSASSLGLASSVGRQVGYAGTPLGGSYDRRGDLISRLDALRKMSRQQIREQHTWMSNSRDQLDVEILRSVSPRQKFAMVHDRQIARQHQGEINSILRELAGL